MEFNCLLKFGDACEPSSEVVVSLGELGRSMLDDIEIYPDISKELDSLRAIVSGLASKPNVIVYPEYAYLLSYVLENHCKIVDVAKELQCNILLTPEVYTGYKVRDNVMGIKWRDIKTMLHDCNIDYEDCVPNERGPDSVGLWFGADGKTYAFPKAWLNDIRSDWWWDDNSHPLHKIPHTNFCLSICCEIEHVRFEKFDNLIILNPARSAETNEVKARTLYLAGKPWEEVEKVLWRSFHEPKESIVSKPRIILW